MVAAIVAALCLCLVPASALAASNIYSLNQTGGIQNVTIPPKTVVLTFDDGPSKYTPQILAILQAKHIHATFFAVGKEAVAHPMLKTIYDDGDDIGNHTYSHPDLSTLPDWRVRLELGLDRLIIESQTGHSTRFIRPPYLGSDRLSSQSSSMIKYLDHHGYVTVGEGTDTNDWQRPGSGWVVANATIVPHSAGGVILLHDGGGDRSETVQALPAIIDYYQQKGFRFLTVSQALGLPRNVLMPTPSLGDRLLSYLVLVVFTIASVASRTFYYLIIIVIVASFGRMILVLIAATMQAKRKLPPLSDGRTPVSVIVPAYNEAAVIQSCLKSILASSYGPFEILVVDDGSSDQTAELATELHDPRIRVLVKPNGGKASALNYGIAHARADFIVAIDADTIFQKLTLPRLMRHFDQPNVGAVSGNTRIVNRHKLITKLQSLEYIIGFNLDRRLGDLFDCITVVPGAIGAFRKEAMVQAGGFTFDTLAEDTDLTLAIKELRYRIVYDHEAIAYTEAPATRKELLKQRFRWTFGTMQATFKHRRAIGNPKYGTLGLIGLPYLLLYQIIFPLIGPFFDLSLLAALFGHRYHLVIVSFIIYTIADIIMAGTALKLDGERYRHLWLLIPQRLLYRQLMYYVIAKSFINVLKGNLVGWGSLKREGTHLANASE